ncbi:hypothetical protein EDB19DRAFT_1698244, partial [Suillus lakei]
KSRHMRHHHRLSLPFPRRPRHLLLLILVLPHQVQQAHSHGPFIADSFFLFLMCISPTRRWLLTPQQMSYLCI